MAARPESTVLRVTIHGTATARRKMLKRFEAAVEEVVERPAPEGIKSVFWRATSQRPIGELHMAEEGDE